MEEEGGGGERSCTWKPVRSDAMLSGAALSVEEGGEGSDASEGLTRSRWRFSSEGCTLG